MLIDTRAKEGLKPLVCKTCAGHCKLEGKSCCSVNDILKTCRIRYIEGTNVKQLREMADLLCGMDNFCNEHGYLYEYVVTQGQREELKCKQCIVELINSQQQANFKIELLNEEFFDTLRMNSAKMQQIEQTFAKMDQKLKQKDLDVVLRKVDNRIIDLKQFHKQPDQQMNNKDKQNLEDLRLLKSAFEERLKSIAQQAGYHEFLHDDFIEDKSLRQKIMGDKDDQRVGFNKKQIYSQFDNIQFI